MSGFSGGGGSGGGGGGGGGGPTTISGPLGSKVKSQSLAVTLSTNEPAIPVSGTVTSNIGTTNGLALDSTLSTFSAKVPAVGQTTMDASLPIVIASDQSAIPVTGSFSNPSVGSNTSAAPTSSSLIGGSDGTNLQAARVFDLDSGGGTEYNLGISLRLPGSGGSVIGGTSSNPVRTDPTGSTTQPVSGTVTANVGTTNGLALDASITSLLAKFGSLGQKAMTGSAPVVIASDQSAIPVTGTFFQVTQPISGTVTSNVGTTNGLSLDATLAKLTITQSAALGSNTQAMVGGSVTTAAPSYTTGNINPLSLTTAGALRVDGSGVTQPVSGTVTANIGTSGSLALDATLSTLSAKIASTAVLADATSNPTVTSLGVFNEVFNGTTWDRMRSGLLGAQSSATGMQNVLAMGRYNSSAPTLTDGQVINHQLDVSGNLKTTEQFAPVAEDNTNGVLAVAIKPLAGTTYASSLFKDLGANATLNVKASSGNVFSVLCQNLNAAIRYLQLHNTATTPSGGAVPLVSIPVPASSTVVVGNDFFTMHGVNFSNGIAFGFSTASGTYTAGSAADQMTEIIYK